MDLLAIRSSNETVENQLLLDYLRAKKGEKVAPPYLPRCDFGSLSQLCQLALLWQEAGFEKEAGQLAHWLSSLEEFIALWCSEKEFDEEKTRHCFSLLTKIEPIPGWKPDFEVMVFKDLPIYAAFTWVGKGTSLGAIWANGVEIRAFGPQALSLCFGIQGKGIDGWSRCFALPEVWLRISPRWEEGKFDLYFVGLTLETPVTFAFYVKAPSCEIGGECFKPKSLRRFSGEGKAVRFGSLAIESREMHRIQIIPLAGEGCFWNCDFLVSFEIHPLTPQVSFSIHKI